VRKQSDEVVARREAPWQSHQIKMATLPLVARHDNVKKFIFLREKDGSKD
jgi:hypothetical protein